MTTDDLDKTIVLLNGMLEKAETLKDKLSITDRLAKFYAMKFRFTSEGKGGKFTALDPPSK